MHWDSPETEFTAPYEDEESDAQSAATKLDSLDLEPGRPIAYVFDFGDSWDVTLRLRELVAPEPRIRYPKLLESRGDPPPQYSYEDDDLARRYELSSGHASF